jgi:hypothetical protein
MGVLAILRAVLSLASALMGYVRDRQLMDAGEAQASYPHWIGESLDAISRAKRARQSVDPDGVPDDPDNRDTLRRP